MTNLESWSLTAFWRRSSLFLISMIWSSVATFLILMIWSSVASDSSASIVRWVVPKSQDLGIAKIGFSERLTRTPGKGLCKLSAFWQSAFRELYHCSSNLLPKPPERRAIYSSKEKRKIIGLSAFCYFVAMNNNWDFLLGQLSWILGKSELGLHAFCSIPLKSWSRCKSDPSGRFSQNVLSIIKSPLYCFKGLGAEKAML